MEQSIRSAVEVVGRDNLVAGLGDVQQGKRDGRLAACHSEGTHAPVESRDALFEDVGGRIHQPCIDVAELGQGKEVGRVFGVLELVRGRLIDRNGPCTGRGVGLLTAMNREGFRFQMSIEFRHFYLQK